MQQKEIEALIRLLDDRDSEVYEQIQSQILTLGKGIIPVLESAWSRSLDALMQQRIENIIHKIQLDALQKELQFWTDAGSVDIIKGALLVARYQYPDLNEEEVLMRLDQMKKDAWLEMN